MSSYKVGVNLRVTESGHQGGRKYMEDTHAIRFVKNDEGGFEFAYFGIFDGHGGGEASKFAKLYLLDEITKYDCFWSEDDEDVMYAIKSGFLDTHAAMWKEVDTWPRTVSGLPSTSGTTASIAIIKNSKLYIGHVGDSGIVLGYDEARSDKYIRPRSLLLTTDHKPDSPEEKKRIEASGGEVVAKSGVQRVVWNRPKLNHKGPIRRSTPIDRIPFLAVARSLGDLWSYNYLKEEFVVSPEPDVSVQKLCPGKDKCLIIGSDGLWNMLTPEEAVSLVVDMEYQFEYKVVHDPNVPVSYWINPSEKLVHHALKKWQARMLKADNTSCIVALIDALGPRKLSILRKQREENFRKIRHQNKPHSPSPKKKSTGSPVKETSSFSSSKPDVSNPPTWNDINGCDDKTTVPSKDSTASQSASPSKRGSMSVNSGLDDSVQVAVGQSQPLTKVDSVHRKTPGHKNTDSKCHLVEKPPSLIRSSQRNSCPDITRASLRHSLSDNSSNSSVSSRHSLPSKLTKCGKIPHVLTDRQQSLSNCMSPSSVNLKDVQNIFQNKKADVRHRNEQKLKNPSEESQNINNSSGASLHGKTKRRIRKAKNIFKRKSLRLRKLQQKSSRTFGAQEENKKFLSKVICGVKRKSISSLDGPPTKKFCKS